MAAPTEDPRVVQPGHAQTPFTADEIREGCPAGRTIGLLVEPPDADPFVTINRFVTVDDEGSRMAIRATRDCHRCFLPEDWQLPRVKLGDGVWHLRGVWDGREPDKHITACGISIPGQHPDFQHDE